MLVDQLAHSSDLRPIAALPESGLGSLTSFSLTKSEEMLSADISSTDPEKLMAGCEMGAKVSTDAVFWEITMWAALVCWVFPA